MKRQNSRAVEDGSQVIDFPPVGTVQSQAAKWLAVLDSDNPSPVQIAEFKKWIAQSEEHREEFESLLSFWGELNILTQTVPPRQKANRTRARHTRLWPQAFACLAVVAVVVMLIFMPAGPSVYVTGIGEQKTIVLPDGTSALLNTNSRMEVDYDDSHRRIRLGYGEALFEIERDPDRPFEVHAGDGTVRALGTIFGVYLVDGSVEVLVTEGVVEIEKSKPMPIEQPGVMEELSAAQNKYSANNFENIPIRVEAGTRAVFDQKEFSGIELAEVDQSYTDTRHAWRHGVLAFDQQPLEEVVKEMARYTSLKFVIPEKSVREMKVGGIFKLGDTDAMAEALFHGFGIRSDQVAADVVYLFTIENQ